VSLPVSVPVSAFTSRSENAQAGDGDGHGGGRILGRGRERLRDRAAVPRPLDNLVVFRDGIPVFGQPGMLPAAALDELLQKVRELDMDDVRRKVAAHEATAASA